MAAAVKISPLYFDRQDHEFLAVINETLAGNGLQEHQKRLLDPYLHPHGIKELSSERELRVAFAMIQLLRSLESGKAEDRLLALRSVKDETMASAITKMRLNTARVQLQLMKELVRSQGDPVMQLELIHDFRKVSGGKPRVVRSLLNRFHLLEVPETWDQLAFDHHVHDANTKGRKTATHMIMDAWIKGIRQITVVYYHYVRPEVVAEVLEAAEIMGIRVRIGVELWAQHRGKYVQMMWVPRGFSDPKDFLSFLNEPVVAQFMAAGREAADFLIKPVMALLDHFNKKHLDLLNDEYGIKLAPLSREAFLTFVGVGQPSTLHLAEFIYNRVQPLFQKRLEELRAAAVDATPEQLAAIEEAIGKMAQLHPEAIFQKYLRPAVNPEVPDPHVPNSMPDLPGRLCLSPMDLLKQVHQLPAGYRINMNLTGLNVPDVLEILYDCQGLVTHLEMMNLKDYLTKDANHYEEIDKLRQAINGSNIIRLKHQVSQIIGDLASCDWPDRDDRLNKLRVILHDLPRFQSFYRQSPLGAQLGSDSTGRSRQLHGMGLVVLDSLAPHVQRAVRRENSPMRRILPIKARAVHTINYAHVEPNTASGRFLNRLPLVGRSQKRVGQDWTVDDYIYSHDGNVATLGGINEDLSTPYTLVPQQDITSHKIPVRYLNSAIFSWLKVLLGFIPAMLSFMLTKEWWLLMYFGAVIWFAITWIRNVMQSVVAGRGLHNAPLLRWRDFVSWDRVADSLLYSGISVPLLDWLVNGVILDGLFGINTSNGVFILYAVNSLVNGVYISSHNVLRGLPKSAIYGNFFRSVLAIPLALAINQAIGGIMLACNFGTMAEIAIELQFWAAMISKLASDLVAAVIEGLADRKVNMRLRFADYKLKLSQVFENYANFEAAYPEKDMLSELTDSKEFMTTLRDSERNLEHISVVNALDMLYFWAYQPRARTVFAEIMKTYSAKERLIVLRSMAVLNQDRRISQLLADRLVGTNFNEPLAFYLNQYRRFLKDLTRACR